MTTNKISLPIDDYLPEVKKILTEGQNCVITAAPGAGKTTRVPVALSEILPGQILILEPRRMAAVAAAMRISDETQSSLGSEVGYQVRFQNKTTEKTKIIFLTEALLLKKIQTDPELSGVSAVILDEFHERSLNNDLALGLLKEMQLLGSQIKVVVMSATLNAESISQFLGSTPILSVPGKTFPLQIRYSQKPQSLSLNDLFFKNLEATLFEALKASEKDVLIFLPGQGEIERCAQRLAPWCEDKKILLQKLHGNLNIEDQKQVLRSTPQRRVILSTNIAESSVTLDGVDAVIDSGLEKISRYSFQSQFSRLELGRISLASATQRAGRAARQKPGICFRLWTKLDEASMSPFMAPEISRVDLSESLLALSSQGIRNFEEFSWFEKPSALSLESGVKKLKSLKAIDAKNEITLEGRHLLQYPLTLELGKILLISKSKEEKQLSCLVASLLQEKDFYRPSGTVEVHSGEQSDLLLRLELLNTFLRGQAVRNCSVATLEQVKKSYQQLCGLQKCPSEAISNIDERILNALLLQTFRLKLARRRKGDNKRGVLTTGKGIQLSPGSICQGSEYFLALSGVDVVGNSDTLISIAHSISKTEVFEFFKNEIQILEDITFDPEKKALYKQKVKKLDQLILEEGPQHRASQEDIQSHLPLILKNQWPEIVKQNLALQKTFQKIDFLESHKAHLSQAEVNAIAVYENTKEDLITKFCEDASMGHSSLTDIYAADIDYLFQDLLPSELKDMIDQLPNTIKVPSGSDIKVHYIPGKNPHIEVRIQEVFGWSETPKIMSHFPIVMHLLGPNYKPVQVTADLKSFWSQAYTDIRKELRLKYPKHQWPEDPKQGTPEAKGRKRT